jgi:hypothetical protein
MRYMTLRQAADITHEKIGTIDQRMRRNHVPVKHEEPNTKGYRNRVLVPESEVMSPKQASTIIRRMLWMDDVEFQESLHRLMLRGEVPYQEHRNVRYREHSGKADFKGYAAQEREEEY